MCMCLCFGNENTRYRSWLMPMWNLVPMWSRGRQSTGKYLWFVLLRASNTHIHIIYTRQQPVSQPAGGGKCEQRGPCPTSLEGGRWLHAILTGPVMGPQLVSGGWNAWFDLRLEGRAQAVSRSWCQEAGTLDLTCALRGRAQAVRRSGVRRLERLTWLAPWREGASSKI
jgi:hypothetical protein